MTKYRDFFEACRDGNVAIVENLLSRRMLLFFAAIDVNELVKINELSNDDFVAYSGIELAAERGHLDIVKLLVENSSQFNTESALQSAATNGHIDILNFLAKTIANPEDKYPQLKSAFIAAFYRGQCDVVEYLLQEKGFEDWGFGSPYHSALEAKTPSGGWVELFNLISKAGYDINEKGYAGSTPLHLAVRGGPDSEGKLISWLLEAGATVDAVDNYGRKPLLYAMANKDAATIKLLHAAGADRDEYGIEDMRSLAAPTIDGSTINWVFGKSVVFELPRWQFDWVTAKQPLFMEKESTSQEIVKAIDQCELEIGLISKQRETKSDGEETPLETIIGLAFYKTVLGYAIANGMDFQTAQTKVSALKDSREA